MEDEQSLKGHTFTEGDLPDSAISKAKNIREEDTKNQNWLNKQTARYQIVAYDGDEPLIAEELEARAISKLSDTIRSTAGMIVRLSPEDRKTLRDSFDDAGNLILPFKVIT